MDDLEAHLLLQSIVILQLMLGYNLKIMTSYKMPNLKYWQNLDAQGLSDIIFKPVCSKATQVHNKVLQQKNPTKGQNRVIRITIKNNGHDEH
jgi:hypothetical protein